MVCQFLQKRFPKTRFSFIPAEISTTCSSTGAFRLRYDILSKGEIDLLFVGFAVNDNPGDLHTPRPLSAEWRGLSARPVCPIPASIS